MRKEIEIPEGYEARIEGNKVIIERKESEDEKIRKSLVALIKEIKLQPLKRLEDWNSMLAYLEKQKEPEDKGEISDGYHTFNELYYYRMLYNAAFFNLLPKEWVHKSKRHHDGEECFGSGWFIVMANLPTGQVSNHYELKDWDLFQIPEKEIADEWDGHTPQEAAERIHKYLLEKQKEQQPAEWSESVKKALAEISDYLKYKGREEDADFIRNLRPQPHWKPSEEQMVALKYALGEGGKFDKAALESLYNELQKLMWN